MSYAEIIGYTSLVMAVLIVLYHFLKAMCYPDSGNLDNETSQSVDAKEKPMP